MSNGFIWDDDDYVTKNSTLTSLDGLSNIWFKLGAVPQYYPLVHSTFWIEYHLWGLHPRGYHVTNLVLHATSVVLVWRLLTTLAVPGAWLAAAIFAVHPVEVESVAWVTERKNVLSCALALGSLFAYLHFLLPREPEREQAEAIADRGPWRFYGLALLLYIAALLSKTVVASVPAVLLVVCWWKRGRVTWRDAVRLAPFFAAGLALSGVTVSMEKMHVGASGQEWDFSPVDRVLIAGRALWFYAGKLIWPHPLVFFYPRWAIDARLWWQYLYPSAAFSVLIGLWLARERIGRGPLAAVVIFAGVLVPALGFFNVFPFRFSFVADHFQYHASIALIALASAALVISGGRLASQTRWVAPLGAISVLMPLALVSTQRTHVYKDVKALWKDTIEQNPTSWPALENLGGVLALEGKYDAAALYQHEAIEILEELLRVNPNSVHYDERLAEGYVNLGFTYQKARRWDEAKICYQKAIDICHKLVRDHPAIGDYQDALALCHVNLALAQHEAGETAEAEASYGIAIEILEQLVRRNPTVNKFGKELAETCMRFGALQRDTGRITDAERSFQKARGIQEKLARDNQSEN